MTWITDNKGSGPWAAGNGHKSLVDLKNQGVWPFTEKQNVWGYINNPRWQSEPTEAVSYTGRESEEPQIWPMEGNFSSGDSKQHIPCGHWHKGRSIYPLYPGGPKYPWETEVYFELIKQEVAEPHLIDVWEDPTSLVSGPSIVNINSDELDGVVKWEFEAIWTNRADEDSTLQVVDDNDNVYAEITLAHNSAAYDEWTLFRTRVSLTPGSGDISYRLKLIRGGDLEPYDSVGHSPDILISAARIIITQANATKTRIQIPMMASAWNYIFQTGFAYNDLHFGVGQRVKETVAYSEDWSYIGEAKEISAIWKYDINELSDVSKVIFAVDAQDTPSATTYSEGNTITGTSDIKYFEIMLYWAPVSASNLACGNATPAMWTSETQVHTDDCTGAVFTPIPGTYVRWYDAEGPYPYSFEVTPDFSGIPHDAKIFIGGDITLYNAPPGPWGHFGKWFDNPATATSYVFDENLVLNSTASNEFVLTFKYSLQYIYSHVENLYVALKNITTGAIVSNSELIWYADEFAYRQETEISLEAGCEYKIVAYKPGPRPYTKTQIYDAMLLLNIDPIKKLTVWQRCFRWWDYYDNWSVPGSWNYSVISSRVKLLISEHTKAYFEATGETYDEDYDNLTLEETGNDETGSGLDGTDVVGGSVTWDVADYGTMKRKRTGEISLSDGVVYGSRKDAGWYPCCNNGFIVLKVVD